MKPQSVPLYVAGNAANEYPDMSDYLSPITVMYLRRMRRGYGYAIIGVAMVVILIEILIIPDDWSDFWYTIERFYDNFMPVALLTLLMFSLGFAVFPGSEMPRRYVDEDLIHYTGLSALEVLFGYAQAGMVLSLIVCVIGYVFLLPFCIFSFWTVFQTFLGVVLVFMFSQAINLFSMSFFSGVRKQYQFLVMGFTLYIYFAVGLVMSIVVLVADTYNYPSNAETFWYLYGIATFLCVSLGCVSGFLVYVNASPRIPLPFRWLRVVIVYAVLYGFILMQ